ncbi:MAG: type I restriction-modification system subunit M N-terminal domain-containing protein [Burkholderiales bacterium]
MSNASQQIVNKAWNFAHVLRDDGLSYMAYTEQITFLLFLKMADEQTKAPYNRSRSCPHRSGGRACLPKKVSSWKSTIAIFLKNSARGPACSARSLRKPGRIYRTRQP